jgi:transposase
MTAVWAGIDSGKRAHHCVVIDTAGRTLLSRRVVNDEAALLELITAVLVPRWRRSRRVGHGPEPGGAALVIALLAERGQRVLYIPGRIVHHAAATYRGDGKTDAKDARIIADQARMRTDLQPVRSTDQISTDLRLLTSRRTDLVYDRVHRSASVQSCALLAFARFG